MTYQLLLTTLGQQKLAAAANVGGAPLRIAEFAIGQGINVDFGKRLNEQVLVSKRYQGPVENVAAAVRAGQYAVTCIVPQDQGGWVIREFGLIDSEGDLIWVGQLPEVQKPVAGSTAAVDYRIKAVVSIDNPQVNLVIDANVISATQPWVDARLNAVCQMLVPFGYKYWTHTLGSPKALFDTLLGVETFWRQLKGVQLVGVDDTDSHIGLPAIYAGAKGNVTPNNTAPDHYPLYTSYLWERYDPGNLSIRYDGQSQYDGTASYQ